MLNRLEAGLRAVSNAVKQPLVIEVLLVLEVLLAQIPVSTALYGSKVMSVMLNGYKHSQVSVILMLHEPHP